MAELQPDLEENKVTVLSLDADAPLRCRFAISPINETTDALRVFSHPDRHPYHQAWQAKTRPGLDRLELGPLLALLPPGRYQPDFINPPPDGPTTDITSQLARIRTTPPGQVAAEVERCLHGHPQHVAIRQQHPQFDTEPEMVRDLLADLLERAWESLVEPWWPQIAELLQADIGRRARQLADAGTAETLNGLHPKIRLSRGDLRVQVGTGQHRVVGEEGVVLLPSVFAWPEVGIMLDPPWLPTVIYPARGIARLWQKTQVPSRALSRLIGLTRAEILEALFEPATTTGLAARCQLPLSTVSEHLAVLRSAGLVTTTRTGRHLSHHRTPLGRDLVNPHNTGIEREAGTNPHQQPQAP